MKNKALSKHFILEEYKLSKKEAFASFYKGKYNQSLRYIEYCATIAWFYPIIYKFIDDEIENLLDKLSDQLLSKSKFTNKNLLTYQQKKIVFYNGQIIDSGALTEQYLNFFISQGYSILLIIPDKKHTLLGSGILSYISKTKNIELFIPISEKPEHRIREIDKVIKDFAPTEAFLHFLPNDTIGYCCFSGVKLYRRFYIVHNDHTFWLGKNCGDYFIEFRHFGISVALERRGIPKAKILHIPFYPIRNEIPFKGFPFDLKNKIIGVSGANLYKYLIDPGMKYFHVIKELLTENPNFVFCLCGWGDENTIKIFIEQNQLQDRFYYLGHRPDFYELVGKSDILFESYPMKGGLTPLFATEQHIPAIGIANYDNCSGSLEELLDIDGYTQPINFLEFKAEANNLIRETIYRKYLGEILSINRYNRKDFDAALIKVMAYDLDSLRPRIIKALKLNDDVYLNEYLNLADSTVENTMYLKLFILKSSIPFWGRLKLLHSSVKSTKTKGFYGLLRMLVLVIIGR